MLLREFRGAIRARAHDRDDFAAVGAEGVDHVLRRDCAGADEPPSEFRHRMASRRIECRAAARGAHDQGCRADDRFRFEISAGEMAHQQLRGARPETAAVDSDGRESGKRVLRLFDVVEADHSKISSDRDPASARARTRPIATTSL